MMRSSFRIVLLLSLALSLSSPVLSQTIRTIRVSANTRRERRATCDSMGLKRRN